MDIIVTIDIGTTAVRIIAYDFEGNSKGYKKGSYPTFHSQPDSSEQDPEQVFITVLFMLKSLLNELYVDNKNRVVAIVFSSSMHSVLPIDKTGTPLGNAMIWADNRSKKVADEIKESDLGIKIYEATGTPIHAMSPLSKITWIQRQQPERFAKAYKFISIKEYVIYQFTNEYLIDYSLASATGLFNIRKKCWEQVAMDIAGINPNYLSEPTTIYHDSGKIIPEVAKSLRLSPDTKIILGSTDGCMATIGSGVLGDGQATLSLTSSGAVRVLGTEQIQDKKQRLFNYILDETHIVSGGPTNNGGVVLDWYARQFGSFKSGIEFDEAMFNIFNEALHVSPGANGLIFLPYLLGERAPIWDSNARGSYFGINIKHETKHFARATIEGIIFELMSISKVLENYRSIKELSLTGTIETLPLWSEMITDIFGLKVRIHRGVKNINLGSALVGLTQLGVFKDIESAANSIKPSEVLVPNPHNHKVYLKYFKIFSRLTQKFKSEFKLLSELET